MRHPSERPCPRVGRPGRCHRTLLLTALAGHRADTFAPGSPEEELAHHEAGRVLGKLHRATPCPWAVPSALRSPSGSTEWIGRAVHADLLDAAEENLLKHHAVILGTSQMDGAICHLDYQPRNWLLGDAAGIFDFEHMRRDARVRDFARLEFRRWRGRTPAHRLLRRLRTLPQRHRTPPLGVLSAPSRRPQPGPGPPGERLPPSAHTAEPSCPGARLTRPLNAGLPLWRSRCPRHEQPPTSASLRRAVVTGSAGVIGSHLAHTLFRPTPP
ncbi:phosphotransferase [Streptomyces sp. KL116D]|uniref:phosphotransferase n=1 Tax=Streptomyces sp. KL116D TaxID=3045152 RepID=UPI003559106C